MRTQKAMQIVVGVHPVTPTKIEIFTPAFQQNHNPLPICAIRVIRGHYA
jgi:hypothetical protein